MKKISLFLFTLCVSVASWAQINNNTAGLAYKLNPYAYDLNSTWNSETEVLTVSFRLNSVPNLNTINGNVGEGIQVFVVDEEGNEYSIWRVTRAEIQKAHTQDNGYYSKSINISDHLDLDNKVFPVDQNLTWKVRVCGRSNAPYGAQSDGAGNTIDYTLPRFWNFQNNFSNKRYISPSIAVNTSPETPNFGDIYIIDNMNPSSHTSTKWSAVETGRGIYVYKPDFKTKAYSGNKVAINPATKAGGFADSDEPRDICVSKNGRVFVCSYSTASTSTVAVWELKNNYTTWTPILNKEDITRKVTGGTTNKHSVVSMDVKGEGDDITLLLLCKGSTNNNNNKDFPLLKCVEYNVSTETLTEIQLPQQIYDFVYYNEGINAHARISYDDTNNWIWCGFGTNAGKSWVRAFDPTIANDKNNVNKNLKVNEEIGNYYGGEAFCVKGNMLIKSIHFKTYERPSIIFRTIDRSKTDVTAVITDNPCFTYNGDVQNSTLDADFVTVCYNDFALDFANNLYVANNWSGQVFPISLPYDGVRTTPAPAGQTFTLADPVPNILATDLCCTPHETKPKYIFSFNVNTKPEGAEIRFYTTEAAMLADTAASGYDKYDNHNNCAYYYRFTEGELKQGRMLVELDILGHKEGKELSDKKLPAGKLYWNVYLKTRESLAFAPIYVQPLTDASGNRTHYRLHATIDNNPDNDGFGHIYAIDYQKVNNDESMEDNPCALMVYTIGDADVDDNNFNGVKSTTRYSLLQNLSTDNMVQPRRPAVAPDGMVYLTDYGDYRYGDFSTDLLKYTSEAFKMGGIWLFDPSLAANKANTGAATLSRFYLNKASETTSGVSFYGSGSSTILYKSNTYEEISHHGLEHYRDDDWANNGYRVYNVGNTDGTINHSAQITDGSLTALPHLDANGSFSVKATSDGVWLCQHRTIAEDAEAVSVLFCNKNGDVKFQSYGANTTNGQPLSNVLKYTPGGGMTVSPDEKYLYVVNYEGNILEFEIGGSAATGKTLTFKNKFINNTDHKTISTMNFDYAGNLVVTTDESYPAGREDDGSYEKTQIVVFTMPYNRDNARTIPASKSERLVPERLSQDFDNTTTLNTEGTYALDLYRPLQGATYNTICLPFDLDLNTLTTPHKLYGAKAMEFTSVSNPTVGGEKVLCLNFTPVTQLQAGKPYIIYVENHVRGLIEFSQVTRKNTVVPQSVVWNVQNSSVTYTGVYNPTEIEEGKTILVDQNRLANVTNEGTLSGFRGYFTIPESLRSLKAMISTRHDTPTGLEDMNITERTYQKFLREGRVYIRVGEALYTITGEKVE